jgi:hypothetical protein
VIKLNLIFIFYFIRFRHPKNRRLVEQMEQRYRSGRDSERGERLHCSPKGQLDHRPTPSGTPAQSGRAKALGIPLYRAFDLAVFSVIAFSEGRGRLRACILILKFLCIILQTMDLFKHVVFVND